jgi:hypothetical protein
VEESKVMNARFDDEDKKDYSPRKAKKRKMGQ